MEDKRIEAKAVYINDSGQMILAVTVHDEYFPPCEETVLLNKKIRKRLNFLLNIKSSE